MKKMLVLLTLILISSLSLAQTDKAKPQASTWSFWVEQNGVVKTGPLIRLTKAPFAIYFKALPGNDFGVAASPNVQELAYSGQLDGIFRAGNGLLIDSPNTKISVSEAGAIKERRSSWNFWAWHDSSEADAISSFQKNSINPDGTRTWARLVDQICIDDGTKDVCKPVNTPVFNKFHLLITRIPHLQKGEDIQSTRWLEPKTATIEFE